MKVGLLLVGEKGLYVLKRLLELNHYVEIGFIASYSDSNVVDDSFLQIKSLCKKNNISFSKKKEISQNKIDSVQKIFVIGWQFLLKEHLDKLVIIHDSKLPELKGWAPTVNSLIEGKNYLAATAFEPTEKMDTGNIYCQKETVINYPMKIKDALDIVSNLYFEIILEICEKNPSPIEMVGEESFCAWRDYEDYFIDWKDSAERINRFINAIGYPYSGAKIKLDSDKILTVLDSVVVPGSVVEQHKHVGKILMLKNGFPIMICGKNLIHLTRVVDSSGLEYTFKKLKTRL